MKQTAAANLIAVAVLCLAAGSAGAQDRSRGFTFGLMGGVVVPDRQRDADDVGPNVQGILGYYLNDVVAIEQTLFAQNTKRQSDDGNDYAYGIGLDLNIGEPQGFSPFLLIGGGALIEDIDGAAEKRDTSPYANFGLGLYVPVGETTLMRVEARYNLIFRDDVTPVGLGCDVNICDDNLEDLRFNLGLMWGGGYDSEPAPAEALPPPAPPADTDADGVDDTADQCPGTPAGQAVSINGCVPDFDGDGVDESKDQCSGTPAGVVVDETGCEIKAPLPPADTDADGVIDTVDQCPGTVPGIAVDVRGCPIVVAPVVQDSDGDGVLDTADQCPGTSREFQVDAVGCVVVETVVLEALSFATNSATLSPAAGGTLANIAASLRAYPTLVIEISGHTDWQGSQGFNLTLSQKRANAVRDALIAQGVPGNRLVAEGYGEFRPIADNNTADGRAKNRRVEFKVLKQ